MLTDDDLPPLPKFFAKHICAEAERTLYDEAAVREYARAVERAAYGRAAQACKPHEDDDAMDRQIRRECAAAILALAAE